MSDRAVLARIAAGEHAAFAELVRRYQQPLFGFLGRMGLSQAQAEDLAQETFLRAWTNLAQFDPTRAQFTTWLHTIARNQAVDFLGAQRQRAEVLSDSLPESACGQPNPMQGLQNKQAQHALQQALRQLPMADRSALALAYVHGLSLNDVARIEGVSLAAVKTRLHRARQALRELLNTEIPQEKHHA